MINLTRIAAEINEFDNVMESYFRSDLVEEINALQSRAIDDFDEWAQSSKASLDAERQMLDHQMEPLREIEAQAEILGERLERERPSTPASNDIIDAYNLLVEEYNSLSQRHKELFQAYQQSERAYNRRVEEYNREFARHNEQLKAVLQKAEDRFNAYRRWIQERGDERFAKSLNSCYASMMRESRQEGGDSWELKQSLERVRSIRNELSDYARKQEETAEHGVVVAEATLCGSEQCLMVVDTGASVVSINPEMVEILGIASHVGDKVEISLAGGVRIKAPQLVIPSMAVQGMKAEYVKAIVLEESRPGVDGCIGSSFLNRFDYQIQKDAPHKLLLRQRGESKSSTAFDVFICHKADDLSDAKKVFDLLTAAGNNPFLSEVSLQKGGDADFRRVIDKALEDATHLVVVCSSRRNIESPWVEAEWGLFLNLKRSGRRRGNIVNVLGGGMSANDLPIALQNYQAISLGDESWKSTLINYLPRLTPHQSNRE
jgi:clan AA aspartic protease (TIGR02281 family)